MIPRGFYHLVLQLLLKRTQQIIRTSISDCVSSMPLKLEEVIDYHDFDSIIPMQWEAYENPWEPFFFLFCPVLGDGPNAREESLLLSKRLQIDQARADPTCHRLKVTDTETEQIIAAGYWRIHEREPYGGKLDQPFKGVAWPEETEAEDTLSCALVN